MSEPSKAKPGGAGRVLPDDMIRVKKLKWLCRRGMKELDVLLQCFLEQQEQRLAAGAFPEFEALLESEDDRIWDWLRHPGLDDAQRYRAVLATIRNGIARTR